MVGKTLGGANWGVVVLLYYKGSLWEKIFQFLVCLS
jgi:hypothetical protein